MPISNKDPEAERPMKTPVWLSEATITMYEAAGRILQLRRAWQAERDYRVRLESLASELMLRLEKYEGKPEV